MPFTFLAHQAVVLPAKLARPHRVSGTALVFGSMAPDFEYFLRGYAEGRIGHTLLGQFVFCLPLTLVVYWLTTRVIAAPLAAHLPDLGDFRLRDYAALAAQPRGSGWWAVVVLSALAGSTSHVVWDSFTHVDGAAVQAIPALQVALFYLDEMPVTTHKLLQHGSTVLGAAATVAMLRRIGRRRLLSRWAAERERGEGRAVPATPVSPGRAVRFWLPVLAFSAAGVVTSVLVMREGYLWSAVGAWVSTFLRTSTFTFVGLCVVCASSGRRLASGAAPRPGSGAK